MGFGMLFLLSIAAFGVVALVAGIKIVKQGRCIIVERLGSYNRTLTSGLNVIVPFVDRPRDMAWLEDGIIYSMSRIDLRENVLDVERQAVITRDNVSIDIDALLYVQITDPVKAIYEIANLPLGVSQLAQTSLRNVIGEMDLDETLASRDVINAKLKAILDDATDKWGTKVNRVEIKDITPPKDIQNAMEKQMQAERERRAKVLDAEGDKQARIARSEGFRQEQINMAEGDKEGQVRRAEGEAEAVRKLAEAKTDAIERIASVVNSPQLATQFLVATDYLETLGKFEATDGDKIYVPYEASSALGSLGSIKELLKS